MQVLIVADLGEEVKGLLRGLKGEFLRGGPPKKVVWIQQWQLFRVGLMI